MPFMRMIYFRLVVALALLAGGVRGLAQPFTVQGPGVNSNDFRVTIFANGLNFPLGMAKLADDSLLVAVNQGANFFNSTGQLVRFTDTNLNGIADGPGTVLYGGLPGAQTAVRLAGSLVIVTGQAKPITILRTGATPADPLTLVGQLLITYPSGWSHTHSALRLRPTPGQTNAYDLLFQIGSDVNFAATTRTATLTNSNIPGAIGTLLGDSVYQLTLVDLGVDVSASNLTRIASGLRNPAGFAFHPATGDLYFEDNGIDTNGSNEPTSADELNFIARTNLGGAVEFFGFPTNYSAYRSNVVIGGAGIQPLIAFRPIPSPSNGKRNEGVNDITFAPPGFPNGLNTGIFLGFHGKFNNAGTTNDENPVAYADPATGNYFHFIAGQQTGIGHLDGLMSTRDSLFVADLVTTGSSSSGAGAGVIYQIKSLVSPLPPVLSVRRVGGQLELTWDRGTLQQADAVTGPWGDVPDAFSPHLATLAELKRFYRAGY